MADSFNENPAKKPWADFDLLVLDLVDPDIPGTCENLAKRCSSISRLKSDAIVQGLCDLVSDIKAGETGDSFNAEKLWFFQLCRRIQRRLDVSERNMNPQELVPFALVFVELLQFEGLLGQSAYFHWDEDEVAVLFLDEWEKVKIPEGETYISIARKRADELPQRFDKGMYGSFLDLAFHLQDIVGVAFAIPTSESTANILGISGRQISTYINLALRQGFLVLHTTTYIKHVKARTFRFVDPRTQRRGYAENS